MTSTTANAVITQIISNMTVQPEATDFDTGSSTFPYVLDDERDEKTTIMQVLQKLMQSEWGRFYRRGDTSTGEELVFENRQHRIDEKTVSTDFDTASDTSLKIDKAIYEVDNLYNIIRSKVYPREIDAAATTVLGQSRNAFSVGAGATFTTKLYYRDPDTGERISGIEQVTPLVSTTDYLANANEDGSGADLTSNISIVTDAGGNAAECAITNNGGTLAYITKLQIRGKGVYRYDPMEYEAIDTDSQTLYGDRVLPYDMAYEDDVTVAKDIADVILADHKDPRQIVTGLRYNPLFTDQGAADFVAVEIGSRIAINDIQANIDGDYFVNGISIVQNVSSLEASYIVWKADDSDYWILGDSTYGVLGSTTKLAY
jgi:hypothetical protein